MNFRVSILCVSIFLMLSSCDKNQDHLFYINDYDDLIYMVEATNVKIEEKKTSTYLTAKEKEDTQHSYKYFGEIYKNDVYTVFILFSQMKALERNYSFEIRTHTTKDNRYIDSFYLSEYNHDSKEFCSGFIDNDLRIEKKCNTNNFIIKKKINNFGQIINLH